MIGKRNVVQKSEVFEDIERKRCRRCEVDKPLIFFNANKKSFDKKTHFCRQCENTRQGEARDLAKDWVYPYKGVNDPKFIKDRDKLFLGQNGWWWGWTKLNTPIKGIYTKKAKEDVYHGKKKNKQVKSF